MKTSQAGGFDGTAAGSDCKGIEVGTAKITCTNDSGGFCPQT